MSWLPSETAGWAKGTFVLVRRRRANFPKVQDARVDLELKHPEMMWGRPLHTGLWWAWEARLAEIPRGIVAFLRAALGEHPKHREAHPWRRYLREAVVAKRFRAAKILAHHSRPARPAAFDCRKKRGGPWPSA